MEISAVARAGMNAAEERFEKAATGIATAPAPADTVSLSGPAVALLSAKNEFQADTRLARVADEMQRSALNMLA